MRLGLNLTSCLALAFALAACGDDTQPTGGTGGGEGGTPATGGMGGNPTTGGGGSGGEGAQGGGGASGAAVGESCGANDECSGEFCLDESLFGWAGGYCSQLCALDGEGNPIVACDDKSAECLSAGSFSVCIKTCDTAADCPGVANQCVEIDPKTGLQVCLGGCDEDSQCEVACDNDQAICTTTAEDCENGTDDDLDGLHDCLELDCAAETTCSEGIADTCAGAATLVDGVAQTGDTTNGTDFFAGVCDSLFGPVATGLGHEFVYEYTATAAGVLNITATAIEGDVGLYARSTCADGSTQIACADFAFDPGEDEVLSLNVAANEVVTIFVDAYDTTLEGDFSVVADFVPVICGDGIIAGAEECDDSNTTSNDGCSSTCIFEPGPWCTGVGNVIPVLAGVPVNGDTSTGTDGFPGASCPFGANGNEKVYSYTPLASGMATFTATPTGTNTLDVVLALRTDCDDDASQVACVDDTVPPNAESHTRAVTAGTPIFIFVDSYSDLSEGPFTLTVTQP